MKLNQVELESASELADSENEALIEEIINPTPDLIIDDDISVDIQFSFKNIDLDTSFRLPDTLKTRLDDTSQDARKKESSINFPGEAIENIPNDPLYTLSQIEKQGIYIDDSLRDLFYLGKMLDFPQSPTDGRKDFEINLPKSDIIVFKLPSLTFASLGKKELKFVLNNIIEDLDLNLKQTLMSKSDKTETKQKTTLLKILNKRLDITKNQNIEKKLQSHN